MSALAAAAVDAPVGVGPAVQGSADEERVSKKAAVKLRSYVPESWPLIIASAAVREPAWLRTATLRGPLVMTSGTVVKTASRELSSALPLMLPTSGSAHRWMAVVGVTEK